MKSRLGLCSADDQKRCDEETKKKMQELELKYRYQNVQAIICEKGTEEVIKNVFQFGQNYMVTKIIRIPWIAWYHCTALDSSLQIVTIKIKFLMKTGI